MKTLKEWEDSDGLGFDDFVEIGDEVDEAMVMYFVEVVPGGEWTPFVAQCGEASRSTEDGLLYATFECHNGQWEYCGDQPYRGGQDEIQ